MPEITYTMRELITLMLRDQEIRSGVWTVEIDSSPGWMVLAPEGQAEQIGVINILKHLKLRKAEADESMTVDASTIWPTKARRTQGSSSRRSMTKSRARST